MGLKVDAQIRIYFGVKGGINFSNLNSDYSVDNEARTGYHLGILAEFKIGKKLASQPVSYLQYSGYKN